MRIPISVVKLHEDAVIPTYGTSGAAGFDFYSVSDVTVEAGQTAIIKTGLAMAICEGFEIQVRPRSGMSAKTKIRVANSPGTIDSDYRGEIGIIVDNTGTEAYEIHVGDRIAQGVLSIVPQASFVSVNSLDETERGAGGYGSTGINCQTATL